MIYKAIDELIRYAVDAGLLPAEEEIYARNLLLDTMHEPGYRPGAIMVRPLPEILDELTGIAIERGIIPDSGENRDLFDTRLMNCLTPRPSQVREAFWHAYDSSPEQATDYYYRLSLNCNYIRRDRIARDKRWAYEGEFGPLDITINKSKPEKDPRDIAAAGRVRASGYPMCLLCAENEGYAGRIGHPARSNHRIIPLTLGGEPWALQYSPYVYYNEHCIVLSMDHRPMAISLEGFRPDCMSGDRFICGKILSGSDCSGQSVKLPVGRVHWPVSVLRLRCEEPDRLADAANAILTHWRNYSDPEAGILARTDAPHNTITPIARRRGSLYEMDLALRNNRTTPEHPLGIFHPHAERHHIKKENIGLIEVMGLAVLPARLDRELDALAGAIASGEDLSADETIAGHAVWAEAFLPTCKTL